MRVKTPHVALLWVVCAVAAYLGPGTWIAHVRNGIDRSQISATGLYVFAALFVVALLATTLWARDLDDEKSEADVSPRRRALVYLAGLVGGIGLSGAAVLGRMWGWLFTSEPVTGAPGIAQTHPTKHASWDGARVAAYRRLGRTGFDVSDISLGSGIIAGDARGVALARAAIERGINYFDTAPDYAGTGTETVLGRAIEGVRDRMFLATKFCTASGHLQAGAPVAEYVAAIEGSLRRLRTDYVDLAHVHACDSLDRLLDDNLLEAFDRLKQQGKVRFLGFSSHTPNLPSVAKAAIDSGHYDVMMLAYHHGAWPVLADLIDRAAQADIGVVAMKTLKGAKHRGMESFVGREGAYSQAAFKWVLSNPSVSALVVSFFKFRHLDEYLHASGQPLTTDDVALLGEYDDAVAGTHCLPHCGACLGHCPEGVPIADVLRHRMYFEDYGAEKLAIEGYARLSPQADACSGCDAPCANACPVGIAIPQRLAGAHRMLTLS